MSFFRGIIAGSILGTIMGMFLEVPMKRNNRGIMGIKRVRQPMGQTNRMIRNVGRKVNNMGRTVNEYMKK